MTKPVTSNYDKFIQECEVHFPHRDVVRVSLAYKFGKFAHRHDVRKGEKDENGKPIRYFEHTRRVARIPMREGFTKHPDTVILGFLHDTIEDTPTSSEEINMMFGEDMSRRLRLLSKVPKEGFLDRLRHYGDGIVLAVKIADRIDNLRTLDGCTPEFIAAQVAETTEHYITLANLGVERGDHTNVRLRDILLAEIARLTR